MKAYKLVRKLKNGQLAPLFINRRLRFPINEWLVAEDHKTKGYAHRPGWHCTFTPYAPHLSTKDRVWIEVEVSDYVAYDRPAVQGGTWILAQKMKVIREIN